MLFINARRIVTLAIAVTLSVAIALPTLPAQAHHTDPPFELTFPQDVEETSFHNDWGNRRSGGRRHRGTDLMATGKMVEVYAIADGIVERISEGRRSGRNVIIEHAAGWSSVYIHLNDDNIDTDDGNAPWYLTLAPGIEEGVEVEAGQLIGWAGDSGNAERTSPHTHFELHYDGRAVNPYRYLVPAFERDLAAAERFRQLVDNQIYGPVQIV